LVKLACTVTTPIVALLSLWQPGDGAGSTAGQSGCAVLTAGGDVGLLALRRTCRTGLVPMADAPAQLFTTLTLFFALRRCTNRRKAVSEPQSAVSYR